MAGLDTYMSQKSVLNELDDDSNPARIIEKLTKKNSDESLDNPFRVRAIGYENPIRPFALSGWIGVSPCSFFRGTIPVIVYLFDNGGRTFAPLDPTLDFYDGNHDWDVADFVALRDPQFKTTNLLTGRFRYIKAIVLEIRTDSTIKEFKKSVASCAGLHAVEVGLLDEYRHHNSVVVQYGWYHDRCKLSSCLPEGRLPQHPSSLTKLPYLFGVSFGEDASNGMVHDEAESRLQKEAVDVYSWKRHDAAVRLREMQQADEAGKSPDSPPDAFVDATTVDSTALGDGDTAEEYSVESLIDHRYNFCDDFNPEDPLNLCRLEFLVKWSGYDESFNTWEPYGELKDCAALDVYSRENRALSIPMHSSRRQRLI